MLRRMFAAMFRPKSPESGNNLSVLLAQAAGQSHLAAGGAHLLCTKCGYDLHGLPGDARCPECGRPVLATATQLARVLTEDVEGDWNIRDSDDVGRMMWAMVRGGVMLAEPGDAPEQFHGLFNVDEWQGEPHA